MAGRAAFTGGGGLDKFLEELKLKLTCEPVLHVDETGGRISGSRQWIHVACTPALTLLHCHAKGGWRPPTRIGVLPGFGGVEVHDRWQPYWRYQQCSHPLCGAHLLRDLAAVAETESQTGWAEQMAKLLLEAKSMMEQARCDGQPSVAPEQRERIQASWDKVRTLADTLRSTHLNSYRDF